MGMYPAGIILKPSTPVDTSAYSAGDLLFDKVEIKNAVPSRGGCSKLVSLTMYNEAGEDAEDLLVMFFDNSTAIGADANEAATEITDAEFKASGFIGSCMLNGGEVGYSVGNGFVYTLPGDSDKGHGLPMLVQAKGDSTSIWVAVIVDGGTPVYSTAADGCKMTFGFEYLG